MEEIDVDVAVIGAGTAGLTARREAEKAGVRVVMIEGGAYGTTCARVGCMPSKLLIQAADVAHEVRGAGRFGIEVPQAPTINGAAVLERVRRERDRFVGFVVRATEDLPESQRPWGCARFVAPGLLELDDHTRLRARAVVIATGSSPAIPEPLSHLEGLLTSDTVFDLETLPRSVAVIGTGVVGMELGQAMHRLGVRTALFSHSSRLGLARDPVILEKAREIFGAELDLHLESQILSASQSGGEVELKWRESGAEKSECFERVLVAAGRRPNLDSLNTGVLGLPLTAKGLPVVDQRTMQWADSSVFLAGDVTGDRPLLHEAADEGHIAGANAARFPDVRAHIRRAPLAIMFTDPNMAVVGDGYDALYHDEIEVGEFSYDNQGRARVMGKNQGHVRLYARRECGTLKGAEMLGPRVEHTAHLLAWAVQQGLNVDEVLAMPFYHPVVEEGIRSGLRDLAGILKLQEQPMAQNLDCGPGT